MEKIHCLLKELVSQAVDAYLKSFVTTYNDILHKMKHDEGSVMSKHLPLLTINNNH